MGLAEAARLSVQLTTQSAGAVALEAPAAMLRLLPVSHHGAVVVAVVGGLREELPRAGMLTILYALPVLAENA